MSTKIYDKLRYVMYCRKSTEECDRQIQSIEDQKRELDVIVDRHNLNVVMRLEESMSAKKEGRPVFNQALDMIRDRKADGIICWKLNRLARNPIDGGTIQSMLQNGTIKSIMTPGKEYLPADNVIMMAIEFGMANQFILDLRKDVMRGMQAKVEKGWRPGRAPAGYLNDKGGDKGDKKIFVDNNRFPLVRKMWDMLLIGQHTISQIVQVANNEWGLRTLDGKTLGLSFAYKVFTNPFYYGEFLYNGELHKGKHPSMITVEEFDRAQKILGRCGKPRPKTKRLPFTGMIVCGECGGMITAEEKGKFVKSANKMNYYLYHRCSRHKKDTPCHQKPIRHDDLVRQIHNYLDTITIPEEFLTWALDILRKSNEFEETDRNIIIRNQQKNFEHCVSEIDNLINLYISPGNIDKQLITEEEFKNKKNSLMMEKTHLEEEIKRLGERINDWLELTEKTFNFATYAKHWFDQGDYQTKTKILHSLGQNFYFKDGKLTVDLQKPYLIIKNGIEKSEVLKMARLEPKQFVLNNGKNSRLQAVLSQWSG